MDSPPVETNVIMHEQIVETRQAFQLATRLARITPASAKVGRISAYRAGRARPVAAMQCVPMSKTASIASCRKRSADP
jgi:hypothetical protein